MSRPARKTYPDPILVTETPALEQACERLASEAFVTVDTEFMREKTYWPILCVVQLASDTEVLVIDALAPGLDLTPLARLLADPAVVKVFHAARQDAEIFLHMFDAVPVPLFDTQVAAMVAGFGDQVGYDSLVASTTGGQIDKGHRFSDWSARPLTPAQIAYAAADVTHLRDAYRALTRQIDRDGRLDWVREEMALLANPATFRPDPDTMWERLRPRSSNRRMLATLQAITAWRECEAQRLDIPRQRLLRDESLLDIASTTPANAEALARVRGIGRGFAEGRTGASLLEVIETVKQRPEETLPRATERAPAKPSPALVALLKVLLAAKAEEHRVAARLIASSDDLDRIALEPSPEIAALTGWRREIFGTDAVALKTGELALAVSGKRVTSIRLKLPSGYDAAPQQGS